MSFETLPLEPDDFYMDGTYLVFTAQYHLRRGYCCNSNCRHCPYKEADDGSSAVQAGSSQQES